MLKNTKAQSAGLITGLIFGIASLVIGVIIAFVVVSTLSGAGLFDGGRTTTNVVNESGWLNLTEYQLAGLDANYVPGEISITAINNGTDAIVLANATVGSTGLVIKNNPLGYNWTSANFTYSSPIYTDEEISKNALTANFSEGVDNVSAKIPTVLLVAAIVLILGVLALLVATWSKMRLGGGSI